MQVAAVTQHGTGQEALYTAAASSRVVPAERVTPAESSGSTRDSGQGAEREEPRDRLSPRLEAMARRAAQAERRQSAGRSVRLIAQRAAEERPAASTDRTLTGERTPAAERTRDPLRVAASATENRQAGDASQMVAPLDEQVQEAARRRGAQPGPAELLGLPDALARYDANNDGRLDRFELRRVADARSDASSYAGLAQPRGPSGDWDVVTDADNAAPWEQRKLYEAGEDGAALPGVPAGSETDQPFLSEAELEAALPQPGQAGEGEGEDTASPSAKLYGSGSDEAADDGAFLPRKLYDLTAEPGDRAPVAAYQQSADAPGLHRTLAVA